MTIQMIVGTSETTAIANVGSSFSPALVADWLDYNKDKSPATIKTYNAALKNFFNWLADNQIVLPKRNDVVEYVNTLCKTKSLRTARLYSTSVKVFSRWVSSIGVYLDFAAGTKSPSLAEENEVHAREALDIDGAKKVLNYFNGKNDEKDTRDALIIRLMMNCALRSVEVTRLDSTDFEKRNGRIMLKIWGKGRKGKSSRVAISQKLYSQIQAYLDNRGATRKKGEPMFTSTARRNKGERLQTQSVSRLAKRVLVACGYDSSTFTCHSLRHTAANLLLTEGQVDVRRVQNLLRHRHSSTTEIYLHDIDAARNNATLILSDLLDS